MHLRNIALNACFVMTFCALSSATIANQPFLTNDPVPTAYHQFELYPALMLDRSTAEYSLSSPALELDYGLSSNIEINTKLVKYFLR